MKLFTFYEKVLSSHANITIKQDSYKIFYYNIIVIRPNQRTHPMVNYAASNATVRCFRFGAVKKAELPEEYDVIVNRHTVMHAQS